MKPVRKIVIYFLVLIAVFVALVYFFLIHKKTNSSIATSTSLSISTQGEWDAGSKSNVLTTGGSLSIDNKGSTSVDLSAIAAADPDSVTATGDVSRKGNPVDLNEATFWETYLAIPGAETHYYWQIDLGATKTLQQIRVKNMYHESSSLKIQTSTDGLSYTDRSAYLQECYTPTPCWSEVGFNAEVKYIRLDIKHAGLWGMAPNIPPFDVDPYPQPSSVFRVYEVQATGTGSATHTTGATQIDGGANFWKWDANTISESVPANTSTSYQYRTSANGSDWTAWVGAIGSVTSRTGDDSNNPTRYRYLQIKATLTNTDGASTPTIDSYDIDYHTEIKPNAPSAQTATTQ